MASAQMKSISMINIQHIKIGNTWWLRSMMKCKCILEVYTEEDFTLASSTIIILFSEMLKFSQMKINYTFFFLKENKEYHGIIF